MKCPNCKKEIEFVHRFLVYNVGDAYPVTEDGDVNIATDELCRPEGSPEPTATIMEQIGGEDVTYRCPECQSDIEGVWNEDGEARQRQFDRADAETED